MKQKYIVSKSESGKQLIIREFAEIDKDIFSQMCEVSYDFEAVRSAILSGSDHFASVIRNRNFFPPITTVQQIFAEMDGISGLNQNESIEIFTDDTDILAEQGEAYDLLDDLEEDTDKLDELLEDEVDVYDENISVKKINSSLKVDDDEIADDNGEM
ncbi:MAG: hypothetical protein R6U50_13725 [Desulfobacterales bacterium]